MIDENTVHIWPGGGLLNRKNVSELCFTSEQLCKKVKFKQEIIRRAVSGWKAIAIHFDES